MVDLVETGASSVDRYPELEARRRAARLLLLLGVLAVAAVLVVPLGPASAPASRSGSYLGMPIDAEIGHPGAKDRPLQTPTPSIASNLPSGVGSGPSGILATLDLVHGKLVPGTDNRTQNGLAPVATAYDPENQLLYVASQQLSAVQVVNSTTRQVVDLIQVPGGPGALVFDPAGHEIYAADYNSNNLSVINDTTNAVVGTIPIPSGIVGVPSGPHSLLYDPLNQTVLVGQYGTYVCCTDNITVVNGATNRIVGEIPAAPRVIALAYNSADHFLYALSNGYPNPTIGITDLVTGASQGNWTPSVPSGFYTGITVDPQGGLVYIASAGFDAYSNVTQILAASGVVAHNTTIVEPGSTFILDSIVYSNSTGKIYFTGSTGELYTITGSSGSLVGGSLDGTCLGPVALTASGRPLVAPDTCAESLVWLDGLTAVVTTKSIVGADPVAVQEIPSTGAIAVLEANTGRLDLLNPTTGAVSNQSIVGAYGFAPAASTVDNETGWLYFYDYLNSAELATGPVVAYDTAAQAVIWTYPVCTGCLYDGLGDAFGEIYLDVINTTAQSVDLVLLNATSGAVDLDSPVSTYSVWSETALPQMGVVPILGPLGQYMVAMGDLPSEWTVGFNLSSDGRAWSYTTGSATGPLAFLPASNLLAAGTAGFGGAYSIDFLNITDGVPAATVSIQFDPLSLSPGANGTEAFVLEGGFVLELSPQSSVPLANITVPSEGAYAGLSYLAPSGGIALASSAEGSVYWIGATLNITDFTTVGPTVQGETFTLQANVTGGYGTDSFAYSGLPAGCVTSNAASLTCLPLVTGTIAVTLRGNDSTGLPAAVATLDATLAPYPLQVNVSSATTYFLTGTSSTFSAGLPASEAGIASFVNFSWALDPAAAGTLNRTNASTVTVTWASTGSVELVVTANLRGTEAKGDLNGSVIASSSTSGSLGLSGLDVVVLVLVVVIVLVVVAVALIARSRGRSGAPPPPPPSETEEPSMDPEAAPAPDAPVSET